MIRMVEYDGEYVPEDLCTINSFNEADDFNGCGACFYADTDDTNDFDLSNCENCIVNKLFQEYAKLTNQSKENNK